MHTTFMKIRDHLHLCQGNKNPIRIDSTVGQLSLRLYGVNHLRIRQFLSNFIKITPPEERVCLSILTPLNVE
jgi:hypothetical protein